MRWPDVAVELDLPFLGIERDQEQIVHRQQRPNEEDDAERRRTALDEHPPQAPAPAPQAADNGRDAHSCTSLVRSRFISTITIGIKSGRADMTAAIPSAGWLRSKA